MKKLSFLVLFLFLTSCTFQSSGKGSKIGRIVKISQEGIFFKTWEGELVRGGFTDGSGVMGTSFFFTIEDDYLRDIALECMKNQNEVIITYEAEIFTSIFRSEKTTPHFVKNIKILQNK